VKRFAVLLVVVAAVVAYAAFRVPAVAASVNGTPITRSSLDADLSAIAGSPAYQCFLSADLQLTGQASRALPGIEGAGGSSGATGVYDADFVRYWLSQRMSFALEAQAVAAMHLSVGSGALALGRATLVQQITQVYSTYQSDTGVSCGATAQSLLAALPAPFVAEQVQAQADQDVLLAHEAGYSLDTASLRLYMAGHAQEFDTVCVSGVAFTSESAAAQARASVTGGASLASTGTVTPIGCALRISFPSSLAQVAILPVGQVSQPVAEGTGGPYVLLEVTSVTPSTLASAKSAVEDAMLSSGSSQTTALLRAANARARVTVDPRYGQVTPGSILVSPPKSPPAASVLDPSAATPSSATAESRRTASPVTGG
jgi:hypothetical protein